MNTLLIQCPACGMGLTEGVFNTSQPVPCPNCSRPVQVDLFPAFFRRFTPGQDGAPIMLEGESSCFYHPQKKAAIPCDACGRFLCALCDCEVKGKHYCPGCLETGNKKRKIEGMEDMRVLHARQALVLSILPFFITGLAAIFVALRYRKEPGSLVTPMRWAFPTALILGILQTLTFVGIIVAAIVSSRN